MSQNVDEFLSHYGVKGMRWGVRRGSKQTSKSKPKKSSRSEKKAAKRKATQDKVDNLVKTALKDPNVLIKLNNVQVVTGKEFVQHLANGGMMNVKTTSIYAQQATPGGAYVRKN